jgi:hypothetical protein
MMTPGARRRFQAAALVLAGVLASGAGTARASEFLFHTSGPVCPVEARKEWGYTVDVLALQGHRWQVRTQSSPPSDSASPALNRLMEAVRGIRSRMAYAPGIGSENPAEALTATKGNCVSYAAALSARAASLGFPAATVHGLLFSQTADSPFYLAAWKATPHRWVRILIPDRGWVSMDPLSPSGFPTRLHVPLSAPLSPDSVKDMTVEVLQWE